MHHICTSFALGAPPDVIQKNYDDNCTYQRAPSPLHAQLARGLCDPEVFMGNLNKTKLYPDYLAFFTNEIRQKGYEEVIKEYVLKGDERANIMFNRLYAGKDLPL